MNADKLLALKALIEERMYVLEDAMVFNADAGARAAANYCMSQRQGLVWARSMLVGVLCEEPSVVREAEEIIAERKTPLRAAPARVYASVR